MTDDSLSYRTHTCGELRAGGRRAATSSCSAGCIASAISAALLFFDVRDRYGITQVVVRERAAPARPRRSACGRSSSSRSQAASSARSAETVNPKLATGEVEVVARRRSRS